MKVKIFILLFVFISIYQWLNSTTWHIKQDGSGDFTTIQEGINASSDADTILVYPGTYFENVDFLSKSIILASLYLTTGNEDYIDQTIIDGNQSGSCVEVRDCIQNYTTLCGFTLTNGTGNQATPTYFAIVGGGVMLRNSILAINNCQIYNNVAESGGGIYCHSSQLSLCAATLKNNRSYEYGGGIQAVSSSDIIFNEDYPCNIYLNYSGRGCEINKSSTCTPMVVIVDTFTVLNPDEYFVGCWDPFGIPVNDITLSIQNAKLEPVDADLYVAVDGDDTNSGLTPSEPLATLNYAYSLIQPDSQENNTIHVANGVYSTTLNDQWFPLQMRSYINLEGESMENTVFDAENNSPLITDNVSELNYTIRNLNLINGYGVSDEGTGTPWILCFQDPQFRDKWVRLENLNIHDCEASSRNLALWYLNAFLNNVHVYDNVGTSVSIESRTTGEIGIPILRLELENCTVKNCHTNGIALFEGFFQEEPSPVIMKNVEITDNLNPEIGWPRSHCGLVVYWNRKIYMVNCTIGNNASSTTQGGAIGCVGLGSELNIYNSILYGNYPRNLWIENEIEENPVVVNIQNTLFEDGEESCHIVYPWDTINWLEGNLDTIPQWTGTGDYPYALASDSPCIDAGTLDLPPGIELPEYDLAGNPRIYGGFIDMGAYEWQGTHVENYELEISNYKLNNFPNPFNPATTLSFTLPEETDIELTIFNLKGQKVTQLVSEQFAAGKHSIVWNGRDDNEKTVSSGIYFYKLKTQQNEITRKMLLLK